MNSEKPAMGGSISSTSMGQRASALHHGQQIIGYHERQAEQLRALLEFCERNNIEKDEEAEAALWSILSQWRQR